MTYIRSILGALLLVAALGSPGAPVEVAEAAGASGAAAPPDLSFPGGGSILFTHVNGWSLEDSAFGIVRSDGEVRGYFGGYVGGPNFAAWDPGDPTRVLAGNVHGADLARFAVSGSSLRRVEAWRRTPYLESVQYSSDGRYMAWTSHGTSHLHIRDLSRGGTRSLPVPDGSVTGWTPAGNVLVARDERYWTVDPRSGRVARFIGPGRVSGAVPRSWRGADISEVSWSPDGRIFSTVIRSRTGRREGIAVGTASGRIRRVLRLGHGFLSTTTWSPTGHTLGYALTGKLNGSKRWYAGVYDVNTDRRTKVVRDVSSLWPPAWSPDGRWLLIDDPQRQRWVFASRDGSETRTYPELGGYPRWGGSTFASPSVNVRIPYC